MKQPDSVRYRAIRRYPPRKAMYVEALDAYVDTLLAWLEKSEPRQYQRLIDETNQQEDQS